MNQFLNACSDIGGSNPIQLSLFWLVDTTYLGMYRSCALEDLVRDRLPLHSRFSVCQPFNCLAQCKTHTTPHTLV
jgi:hypothetical protein